MPDRHIGSAAAQLRQALGEPDHQPDRMTITAPSRKERRRPDDASHPSPEIEAEVSRSTLPHDVARFEPDRRPRGDTRPGATAADPDHDGQRRFRRKERRRRNWSRVIGNSRPLQGRAIRYMQTVACYPRGRFLPAANASKVRSVWRRAGIVQASRLVWGKETASQADLPGRARQASNATSNTSPAVRRSCTELAHRPEPVDRCGCGERSGRSRQAPVG